MIYTYSKLGINGAAGNQLWQIAGTVGLAASNSAEPRIPDWPYRKFFSIPDEYFDPIPDGEEVIDLSPDYLQDKTLWDSDNKICDMFTFSNYAWSEIFDRYGPILREDEELIAVHVRRGNNVQLPDHHPVCPVSYFEKALDVVGGGQVVVFSDDLDWCKKQSIFKDAYFTEGNDKNVNVYDLTGATPLFLDSIMIDLTFMAQCDKHIISNSSFSWWGAYLAYGPEVIYPKRWYGKALQHVDISNMFPMHWQAM